jgi:hypothetical protein
MLMDSGYAVIQDFKNMSLILRDGGAELKGCIMACWRMPLRKDNQEFQNRWRMPSPGNKHDSVLWTLIEHGGSMTKSDLARRLNMRIGG